MNKILPTAAHQRAADFISANGTGLQQALYGFHFLGRGSEPVLEALVHYQNEDGGFGHGLEPDLRTARSSVIATTIALQIATDVDAGNCTPVRRTLGYIESQYRHDNWPLISADCNDAPHAPWWRYDADWASAADFLPNPGAEIISHYLTFKAGRSVTEPLLDRALVHLAKASLEMHEFLCYLRLADNPALDPARREAMSPFLLRAARESVKVDPSDWEEYGLMPVSVVFSPDSLLAEFFGDVLDRNLDYLIGQQKEDGRWAPSWTWGGEFAETWEQVEPEISAGITLNTLVQLKRFHRVQPLTGEL